VFFAGSANAKERPTRDQLLASAFPGCTFERQPRTLTRDQMKQVKKQAGTTPTSPLIFTYRALRADASKQHIGTVYFDAHKVRTLPEVLLIAVNLDGTVRRVEVADFKEPQEYEADPKWLAQFDKKAFTPQLQLKRDVQNLVGCTLSARAATDAVRRVLVIDAMLKPTTKPK